jgi:hypothetical protein
VNDRMWPLMSWLDPSKSAPSTDRAALWCKRYRGFALEEAKVCSKKATPTPFVPPTSLSAAGILVLLDGVSQPARGLLSLRHPESITFVKHATIKMKLTLGLSLIVLGLTSP